MFSKTDNINLCNHCANHGSCDLGAGFFEGIGQNISITEKGQNLFNKGDSFSGFFVVCEGIVRAKTITNNNVSIDFYYPGDVVGLCGMSDGTYQESVTFINNGRVFEITKQDVETAIQTYPEFATKMLKILSRTLVKKQKKNQINTLEAEARLLQFLKEQSRRHQSKAKNHGFTLQMTRSDIASHLGIAGETLSRLMRKLALKGLIAFNNKDVALLNNDGLLL